MPVVTPLPATLPLPEGSPDVELGADGLPGRQFGSRPDPGVDGDTPRVPVPAATGRLHRRRPVAMVAAISFIAPSLRGYAKGATRVPATAVSRWRSPGCRTRPR